MLVLSINFGHDASLSLFRSGELLDFLEIERDSRLKHHFGVSSERISNYLQSNKVTWEQVDFLCFSGTQYWGNFSSPDFIINYGYSLEHSNYFEESSVWDLKHFHFGSSDGGTFYREQIEFQGLKCNPAPVRVDWLLHTIPNFAAATADEITKIVNSYRYIDEYKSKQIQSRFFCPMTVMWKGRKVPGFFVDHHAAHANYAAYYSTSNAIIATHDGGLNGSPYNSGGVYINFRDGPIYPVLSHGLLLGNIYDLVSAAIGLDAGKLMGLSSYARPNRHIEAVKTLYLESVRSGSPLPTQYIIDLIFASAQSDQLIRQESVNKFTFNIHSVPLNVAIQAAANTQALVQSVYVNLISDISEKIREADNSFNVTLMTGGFSLNCPTNSLINKVSNSLQYCPLPAVGDTGISIGAAVAFFNYINVPVRCSTIDNKMTPAFPPSFRNFLSEKIISMNIIHYGAISNASINELVNELSIGKVICVHQGRSEVGPRALGHRSIIGWAGDESVRDRINAAKGREAWRPLAPIVLRSDFDRFFSGDPDECSFMLTVSKVKNHDIPAVTHVDNTARVQVLDPGELFLSALLNGLKAKGIAPVIVNTSFNCAGEPLVESYADSIQSFCKMKFDYLVLDKDIFTVANDVEVGNRRLEPKV